MKITQKGFQTLHTKKLFLLEEKSIKTKVGEYIRMEPLVIIETQPDLDGEYLDNLMFNL